MTNTSDLDITWTANILVGSNEQSVPVIFNTLDHRLVLEGCTSSCTGLFEFGSSGSFTAGAHTETVSLSTNEMTATDYVCSTNGDSSD